MKAIAQLKAQVAQEITADMVRLQLFIRRGVPTTREISAFAKEISELFAQGYLKTVEYGFWDFNVNEWIIGSQLLSGDGLANQVPRNRFYCSKRFHNSPFDCYVAYTAKWDKLSSEAQQLAQKRMVWKASLLPYGDWDFADEYNFADRILVRKQIKL